MNKTIQIIVGILVLYIALVLVGRSLGIDEARSTLPTAYHPTWTSTPSETSILTKNIPTPVIARLTVKSAGVNYVNLRKGPGLQHEITGRAFPNGQFVVTGRNAEGDWYELIYENTKYWIYGELVDIDNSHVVPVVKSTTIRNTATRIPTRVAVSVAMSLATPTRIQARSEKSKVWLVEELVSLMKDNQLKFENSFSGRNLRVRGEVLSVRTEMSGTEVWIDLIGVNRSTWMSGVTCRMPIKRQSQALSISKGDVIVVAGTGGDILITFDIEDCRILIS